MTFYQKLQLNQAGSKELIRNTQNYPEKIINIAIYLFKIFITILFCMAVVIAYSKCFGAANSIVGVVVLLFILTFRNVDLSFQTSHAISVLFLLFFILAFGPKCSNLVNPFAAFLIHSICIGSLLFFGCYHIQMFNHSTILLGYLLLYGYDVSGQLYSKRLEGLALGACITALIYYRKHHHKSNTLTFSQLIQTADIKSYRTRWQIAVTLAVSSVLLLASLLHLPRPMWIGIAVMSIMTPLPTGHKEKAIHRSIGNLIGALLVFLIYTFCPSVMYENIGILGGIGVGLSATYGFQSVFNTFGAIAIASTILGFPAAIFFRIFNNIVGAAYGVLFHKCFFHFSNKYMN